MTLSVRIDQLQLQYFHKRIRRLPLSLVNTQYSQLFYLLYMTIRITIRCAFSCFSYSIFRRTKKDMIKSYQFPNIFQNVVGQVIPEYAIEQSKLAPFPHFKIKMKNLSDRNSIPQSSESDAHSTTSNFFGPKAKRKKLVRRIQSHRTDYFLTNRQNAKGKKTDFVKNNETPKFSNFLRKKQNQLGSAKNNENGENNKESLINIELSESQIEECDKLRKSKRNLYRVRTSIDGPLNLNLDGIQQESDEDYNFGNTFRFRQDSREGSKQDSISALRQASRKKTNFTEQSLLNMKKKQKYNILKRKSDEDMSEKNQKLSKRGDRRKQTKKKTVLFDESVDKNKNKSRKKSKKSNAGSISSKYSKDFSNSQSNKLHSKLSRFKSKQYPSEHTSQKSVSFWTGKSVCSIKFDDDSDIQDESQKVKSLRSRESLLQTSRNLKFKRDLLKTRTAKFIHHQDKTQPFEKPFKSEKKIKQFPRNSASLLNKFGKGKKNQKQKKTNFAPKQKATPRKGFNLKSSTIKGSVLKKQELEYIHFNGPSIQRFNSLKQNPVFNEQGTRVRNNRALNKTQLKSEKQNINVYDELNTFLRFIHEKDNFETEREIPKTFNKPIVIPDERRQRQINQNRQFFDKQNLCIDMGLKLVKRMNKLAQKKY